MGRSLSGLNTTGHEVGGAFGVAMLVSIATAGGAAESAVIDVAGIADAFLAASLLAGVGGLIALLVLPSAGAFLPKLRLAPTPILIH